MEATKLQVPAEEASPAEPLSPVNSQQQKRKAILAMLLTLCFGLLLASLYLGGRFSARHTPQSAAQAKPSPLAAQTPAPAKAEAKSTAPPLATPAPTPTSTAGATPPVAKPAPVTVAIAKAAAVRADAPAPAKADAMPAAPGPLDVTPPQPVAPAIAKPAPVVVAAAKASPVQLPPISPVGAESLANSGLAHPKPGHAYVQVGAFVSPYAERWVNVLEQRGFHPIVAEGPNSAVHRVLLGPLGPAEVSEVEAKLR